MATRREAAAMTTSLKFLGGRCRGKLKKLVPVLQEVQPSRTRIGGIELVQYPRSKYPLDRFRDSYLGSRHVIWEKISQHLIERGKKKGWLRIIRQCKNDLINK